MRFYKWTLGLAASGIMNLTAPLDEFGFLAKPPEPEKPPDIGLLIKRSKDEHQPTVSEIQEFFAGLDPERRKPALPPVKLNVKAGRAYIPLIKTTRVRRT